MFSALNNGKQIPTVGFGTYNISTEDAKETVLKAVKVGYRHFDCASAYGNQRQLGEGFKEAIATGLVKREDLWITSKLWVTDFHAEDVAAAARKTLSDLGLSYLDLYLVHWPCPVKRTARFPGMTADDVDDVPMEETWGAMEKLVDEGLAKSIGVANFSPKKLDHLLSFARICPAVNQVEVHVLLQQKKLREYCSAKGIHVTSYCTLGNLSSPLHSSTFPDLLTLPAVKEISQRSGLTSGQVLLRWAVQSGVSVIPKSASEVRMKQNFEVLEKKLAEDDMKTLESLNENKRCGDFGATLFGRLPAQVWDE